MLTRLLIILLVIRLSYTTPSFYRSPLDEDIDYFDFGNSNGKEPSAVEEIESHLANYAGSNGLSSVTACRQRCTQKFGDLMKITIQSSNHYERFINVCDRYNETLQCMEESNTMCFNQEPFHVFTSGLYYMCIDQRKAFEAVIECIDVEAQEVQRECDEQCQTKGKLANWAIHSGLLDNLIGRIIKGASAGAAGFVRAAGERRATPNVMRSLFQEGCELAQCQLNCIRVKFNTRCHKSAGTLLSETLVRPIAETQKIFGLNNLQSILSIFVPQQCDFVMNSDSLSQFRIDPKLDETLRKSYTSDETNLENLNITSLDQFQSEPNIQSTLDESELHNLGNSENNNINPMNENTDNGESNDGINDTEPSINNDSALDDNVDSNTNTNDAEPNVNIDSNDPTVDSNAVENNENLDSEVQSNVDDEENLDSEVHPNTDEEQQFRNNNEETIEHLMAEGTSDEWQYRPFEKKGTYKF